MSDTSAPTGPKWTSEIGLGFAETFRKLGFKAVVPSADNLEPAPIPPEWIVDGAPVARMTVLAESADGGVTTTLWDCTAGTFRWHFTWEETVHIVEGEVIVTDLSGRTRRLVAGDVGYFPGGTWALWHVPEHVRKIAFCRQPAPRIAIKALRLFSGLLTRLTRPHGSGFSKAPGLPD
ncbi:hypothetical protein HDIA_4189 [Hartmannibacter diazotrophicus]|uniref:(S)-ureidoglycine aminohydrolase cupin domain-containing protein n=1 Tax=Hartmannibacter diazotrophicus TaxID=1482074 RepID=A0A2C9DC31_9HYPH|nr:cupin domain-containing protein [Hartmannibacter diazotrophicus]SON57730.1 hypothetical protein HDIA_4189 [Hartmannibacter diazotrophicus]